MPAIAHNFPAVDTKDSRAVREELLRVFRELFPGQPGACIEAGFSWVEKAFAGRYADYQAIDARYHDFEHTLQGALCLARLLEGYHHSGAQPPLTRRMFELGILAILLHDTGYLKKRGDNEGTGAKYTLTHVARSADFAGRLLREEGFAEADIRAVQNMIRCTGVNTDLSSIPFQEELERKIGFALGTADLLGQMAAEDYVEKLGILFLEFEEANRYSGKTSGPGVFASAEDLREKTPVFWERYVLPKIKQDFEGLFRCLEQDGENPYLRQIERNLARLRRRS